MIILASFALSLAGAQSAAPAPAPKVLPAPSLEIPALNEAPSSAIGDELLKQSRGGQTIIVNDQTLIGLVEGNSIGDYTAGSVSISDQALSNFNGLGNLLINTGAQNSLQAGMSVTINVNP